MENVQKTTKSSQDEKDNPIQTPSPCYFAERVTQSSRGTLKSEVTALALRCGAKYEECLEPFVYMIYKYIL